jgi:hypothetical protein
MLSGSTALQEVHVDVPYAFANSAGRAADKAS